MKYNAIIIVGPTACGKTGLAIELAKKLNSEIVGADSQQVYKYLNIGTAKANAEELGGVKHHLIDVVEPNKNFTVTEYYNAAYPIIERLINENKVPIIVGGTGFYIESLIGNNLYGNCPASVEIREKYASILAEKGKDYIFSILQEIDPETARKLHPNDVKRVVRAIEIFETTGKRKSEIERENKEVKNDTIIKPLIIGLNLSAREKLYNKINLRVDIMFDLGLEKEVKDLLDNGVSRDCQSLQAIGYKEFFDYFDGKITLDELKDLIKINTRHYAKRQITYFKRLDIFKWYNTDTMNTDEIANDIISKLD